MKSLAKSLENWTDPDYAMYELSVVLGLVDVNKGSFAGEFKWIYWSTNIYYEALQSMLFKMVELGFLEYDDEIEKVRVNPNFELKQ
jgi:hypothetical protein